jgi:acetyl esterase/lipase
VLCRPQHRQGPPRVSGGHGVVVVSLDWRTAQEGAYPLALADINYAIRWTKLHAKELKTRPDLVGISGQSSGGHLAMLAAMRPHDPRYTAIPLPAGSPALDATVKPPCCRGR